jgi:hypothetical protein
LNGGQTSLGDMPVNYGDDGLGLTRSLFYADVCPSKNTFGGEYAKQLRDRPCSGQGNGALEAVPHDTMHDQLGGDWIEEADPTMPQNTWLNIGLMGYVPYAARDPIFWVHHAQIDRLWEIWRRLGGKEPSDKTNPEHKTWLETAFKFYDVDANGAPKPITITVEEFLKLDLEYGYDDLNPMPQAREFVNNPAPVRSAQAERLPLAATRAENSGIRLGVKRPKEVTLAMEANVPPHILDDLTKPGNRVRKAFLSVDGIKRGKQGPGGLYYEVYFDLPKDEAPKKSGPYYAGAITLFGIDHGHPAGHKAEAEAGTNALFDVTSILLRARSPNRTAAIVGRVTFVPRYGTNPPPKIEKDQDALIVGHVRLIYEQ